VPLKDILILGFGSDILSDEGLAVRLVQDLKKKWPELADFNTYLTFSLDVIYDIIGYETLIMIDTVEDLIVGNVNRFLLNEYIQTLHINNYHDISLKQAIAYGKKIEIELPVNIELITISITEIGLIDDSFSKSLNQIYQRILFELESIVNKIIIQPAQKV
jgi:hydrogenase maturation protease